MPPRLPPPWRHRLRAASLAAAVLGAASAGPGPGGADRAVAQTSPILMVSRGRVLEDVAAARHLSRAESVATESLQREIDAVRAELAAEEEELTRLRATLPRDAFDARVAAFDQRVREERRMAQSRAAALQRAYRDARRQLVDALGGVLEELRLDLGAVAILDAEGVLAVDPAIDVTARAIALFDDRVSVPVVVMPSEPGARAVPDQPPAMAQPVPGLHGPSGSGPDASGADDAAAPPPATAPVAPGAD